MPRIIFNRPSKPLATSSLMLSKSLRLGYEVTVLTQRVESVTNALFPDIALNSDAMPTNCFCMATVL
jgi:hypothetical protein